VHEYAAEAAFAFAPRPVREISRPRGDTEIGSAIIQAIHVPVINVDLGIGHAENESVHLDFLLILPPTKIALSVPNVPGLMSLPLADRYYSFVVLIINYCDFPQRQWYLTHLLLPCQ
jgi:hypothetical protein